MISVLFIALASLALLAYLKKPKPRDQNHTIAGEGNSSSPELKISMMFCADAEIPVLCRHMINGERELVLNCVNPRNDV